jgi:hypothetical protein
MTSVPNTGLAPPIDALVGHGVSSYCSGHRATVRQRVKLGTSRTASYVLSPASTIANGRTLRPMESPFRHRLHPLLLSEAYASVWRVQRSGVCVHRANRLARYSRRC